MQNDEVFSPRTEAVACATVLGNRRHGLPDDGPAVEYDVVRAVAGRLRMEGDRDRRLAPRALSRAAVNEKRTPTPAGEVEWRHADAAATPPEPRAYDPVSVQYFPVRRQPPHDALRALLDAVLSDLPADHGQVAA
jgi:hypothetical protein